MAVFTLSISIDPSWSASDELVVMAGTENADSLAASTPAGGTEVYREAIGVRAGLTGTMTIEFEVFTNDPSAVIPLGVKLADQAGNESSVFETFDRARDAPDSAGRPAVAATANPNEALITWPLVSRL